LAPILALALGAGGALGQPAAVRPGEPIQRAQLELRSTIVKMLEALALPKGARVACYGMTDPLFLAALAESLGPEGQAYAVYRNLPAYQDALLKGASGDRRVEAIFAADGDGHMDSEELDLVLLLDVDGFFKRESDLHRQARDSLRPGGRLVILRLLPKELLQQVASGLPPSTPEDRRAARLRANQEIVQLERIGLEFVDELSVLIFRTMRVYRQPGGSVGDHGDGPA